MDQSNNCPTVQEITAFLDIEPEPQQKTELAEHLDTCPACQTTMIRLTSGHVLASNCVVSLDLTCNEKLPALHAVIDRLKARDLLSHRHISIATNPETDDAYSTKTSVETEVGSQASSSSKDDFVTETELGKYQLKEELGRGGSGIVYLARDCELDRMVAIKMLRQRLPTHDDSANRLKREARSIASLCHPNIVRLHELGQDAGGNPYLVFEYVEGTSLGELIAHSGTITFRKIASVLRDVAEGLSCAHDSELIHRDIKPSNIIVESNSERAKIVDFGLAIDIELESRITQPGMLAGTPAYMSPEQVRTDDQICFQSDIYSLGVVLYECLVGDVPFPGVSKTTLYRIEHELPADPKKINSGIPRDLATIALKAIAKDPGKRYPTARDFADDLQRWLDKKPVKARPVSTMEKIAGWAVRNPVVAVQFGLIGSLVVALFIGSLVMTTWLSNTNEKLKVTNARLEDRSADVQQQRNALLQSIQGMMHRVNDPMDSGVVDIDKVQQDLMELAISGLESVAFESNDHVTRFSAAEAHCRLATILFRRKMLKDARKHLQLAREQLSHCLSQPTPNRDAVDSLNLRLNWLAAIFDFEPDTMNVSIRRFEVARSETDEWNGAMNKELFLDAVSGLGQLGDLYLMQNEPDQAQECFEQVVTWIDRNVNDENTMLWENVKENEVPWLLKIYAWRKLADLAWHQGNQLETGKYDSLVEQYSALISYAIEQGNESAEAGSAQSSFFSKNFTLIVNDSDNWGQHRKEVLLREYYVAIGDPERALAIAEQISESLHSASTDQGIETSELTQLISSGCRLATICIENGRSDQARAYFADLKQLVNFDTYKSRAEKDLLNRLRARIDFVGSVIAPTRK